ncbi:MAG: histidine phosphatase family protein [Butyrivibrio sp.]|nr:histidine phosphatase family protein [Butyrivibrio sp.]
MRLYVMRHGETDWNVQKRLQGRSDTELNDNGIRLAKVTAEALKGLRFDAIYSSPLKRAYKTAEIVRGERNIPITADERLLEISFGECEGLPVDGLPACFADFFGAPERYAPTGGGERFEDVIARAGDFIENVVVPQSFKLESMLTVAHGAMNNALAYHLLHREIKDYWAGVFPGNCSVSEYKVNGHDYRLVEYGKIFYGGNKK